jgi:hypothetical protein
VRLGALHRAPLSHQPASSPHSISSLRSEMALKLRTHWRLNSAEQQPENCQHQGISFNCLFTQTDCLFIFRAKLGDVSFPGHSLSDCFISNGS